MWVPEIENGNEFEEWNGLFQNHLMLSKMDLQGNITQSNDLFCKVSGYSKEELIGKPTRILKSGFHPHSFFKELWLTILSGRMWHGDIKNRKKSGEYYWVRTTIIPVRNRQGDLSHFIDIKLDITKSKEQEEKHHFDANILREIVGVSQVGGWVYFPETQELYWSKETYLLHDVPVGEKITIERAYNFYTSEAKPVIQWAIERAIREHEGWDLELPICTEKGRNLWTHTVGKVEIRNSKVYRIFGTFQDISDRKAIIDQLKNTQQRLKLYLKHTPAAIAVFDREMRYLAWSDRWIKDYDLQIEELEGISHDQLFPNIPDIWKDHYYRVLNGSRFIDGEYQFTRLNGKTEFVEYQLHPWRDNEGIIAGVFMFMELITERIEAENERKELDRKLLQSQKLESLGVMAGGIAHDFNNLLAGIIGNVEFIRSKLPEDSLANRSLNIIEQASQRASELCSQMLSYAGKGRFEKNNCQLNDLIQETLDLVQHSLDKRIVVHLDLQDLLPQVFVDCVQIRQIIMNLIINAGDSIGSRFGEISIQTRAILLTEKEIKGGILFDYKPEGYYVHFKISDSGSGMSEETLTRIFEPFFTTKFTGRGLGLSAVLGIIKGHQGFLNVCSKVNRGTVFDVYFPAQNRSSIISEVKSKTTQWTAQGVVLLVEDEQLVREIAARRLKGYGFEVLEAENGVAGWDFFLRSQNKIRLIITDLTMPMMSGGQLLERVREVNSSIPCIIMSAYSEEEIQNYTHHYKDVYFLKKPGNSETFLEAVKKAYERIPQQD